MTIAEIKSKIAAVKANTMIPEGLKAGGIAKLEKQLKEAEEAQAKPAPAAPAAKVEKPAKEEKKAPAPKAKKEKKAKVEKKIKVGDKTITPSDPDFCKEAEKKWHERRAKAKLNHRKHKTTPVFEIIASDVAHSVMKAVKSVSVSEIKKDPTEFKKEAEKLETAAKDFLHAFKEMLGSSYKGSEIEKEFKELEKVVGALISKHKKTMEEGGVIKNQYKGKTSGQVWIEWTKEQKQEFLVDHQERINQIHVSEGNKNTTLNAVEFYSTIYTDLPRAIQMALKEHVSTGQYDEGGEIEKPKFRVVSINSLRADENEGEEYPTVTKVVGDFNTIEEAVNAYSDLGNGMEVEKEIWELSEIKDDNGNWISDHNEVLASTYSGREKEIAASATEAAAGPVTQTEEVQEEKEIEKALKLAAKAAKHEVHATDTSFEGFKNRLKDHHLIDSYSEIEQKIAYDCLHISGFKHGGKITNRIKNKFKKVSKVMREFYHGKLRTHGRRVKDRAQAQAIAFSEAGLSRHKTHAHA